MSAAFYVELNEMKSRMEQMVASVTALGAKLDAAVERLTEVEGDRRALRKEVKTATEQLATLNALKESIARDAREILGATRDVIDPTQVKMPKVLKTLGYVEEPA
jgi:chromosome segregation ATPase